MKSLTVALPGREYDILIASGILSRTGAECRKVLENIAHICSTRYEGRTASGASEFTISGYRTDIRKELFSAIAESGLYIERLVPAGKTLEEIYLGMIEASEAEFEKARKRAEQKRTEQEKKGEDDEDDLFQRNQIVF